VNWQNIWENKSTNRNYPKKKFLEFLHSTSHEERVRDMIYRQSDYEFCWQDIGDIDEGRPNMGSETSLVVYRLMQYTIRAVISKHSGNEFASEILREAGWLAGTMFCQNVLDTDLEPFEFIADLQAQLRNLKVGILRMEKTDLTNKEFTITVAEDLDCSGLPVRGYPVCEYDEGFLRGVFESYLGQSFTAREVECWSTGDRTCRFEVKPVKTP
jgi:predicted hydrocarbon binding protein